MPHKVYFLLKDNNVIYLVREWHYGDIIPAIYYFYIRLRPMRFKLVNETKKFIIYERIK